MPYVDANALRAATAAYFDPGNTERVLFFMLRLAVGVEQGVCRVMSCSRHLVDSCLVVESVLVIAVFTAVLLDTHTALFFLPELHRSTKAPALLFSPSSQRFQHQAAADVHLTMRVVTISYELQWLQPS